MMSLKLKPEEFFEKNPNQNETSKTQTLDLGDESQILYIPRFMSFDQAWRFFDYLNNEIPWTRPTIRVFGRSCLQPRDTCYVANPGLPDLIYSGYQPRAYSWDDFPPLKDILDAVHKAIPGSSFNSLLLNKYKDGNDYVAWHSDNEKLYGSAPDIASVSFGCDREFLLKKKPGNKSKEKRNEEEPASKRLKKSINQVDQHSFTLKHGSLLVMRGYTQRDWLHSVPKRAKAGATRINLTFRHVV
ncbi:hypothetical protein CsatA_021464 [Cannabis sativa]